jgi:hypothetical protein
MDKLEKEKKKLESALEALEKGNKAEESNMRA